MPDVAPREPWAGEWLGKFRLRGSEQHREAGMQRLESGIGDGKAKGFSHRNQTGNVNSACDCALSGQASSELCLGTVFLVCDPHFSCRLSRIAFCNPFLPKLLVSAVTKSYQ